MSTPHGLVRVFCQREYSGLSPTGYKAYLAMLMVDNAHNNPTMRVFAHLLWSRALAARFRLGVQVGSFNDTTPLTPRSSSAG